MKSQTHRPLGLEKLEDRWVPASIQFDGSNLTVSNPLITAGKSTLSVIQTSATTFQVKDGAANNGFYAVSGNINVQGNNAKDAVTVNVLAGSGLSGNLSVNAGNGANSVTVDSTAATGFIAGNTNIALGNGTNTVSVGGTVGLTEKGSLAVSSRGTGASTLNVITAVPPGSVLGSTTIAGFPTVNLGHYGGGGAANVFAGGVSINNTGNPQTEILSLAGTDLGNFTVQGGQGPTNEVMYGSVLGTVAFNLGNAGGVAALDSAFNPITIGNLIYNSGNGNTGLGIAGAANILGNAVLNWGNGANALNYGGIVGTAGLTVDGNMSITNGNGGLDAKTFAFQGVVNGNLTVNAGNGSNSFTLDGANGANVGGIFSYTGGNGGNSVTVTTTAADLFNLNTRFGNGSANAFTIGTGLDAGYVNGTLTGSISWGVPTSAVATVGPTQNGFFDNGYVWQNNVTLTNIPS